MSIQVIKDEADKKPYSPFEVKNKQSGYRYRLLNKNERNLERRAYEGYEIVQGNMPEHLTNLRPNTQFKKGADADTTHQYQDVILARIKEERVEEKRKEVEAANRRLEGLAEGGFKADAGKHAFTGEGGGNWSGSMTQSEFDSMGKGKG